jgi:exonuclease III
MVNSQQPGKLNKGLKIGTWNVVSLYRPRALKTLLDQLKIYKIGITCIQEITWNGTNVTEKKEYTVFIPVMIKSTNWELLCC